MSTPAVALDASVTEGILRRKLADARDVAGVHATAHLLRGDRPLLVRLQTRPP